MVTCVWLKIPGNGNAIRRNDALLVLIAGIHVKSYVVYQIEPILLILLSCHESIRVEK